MNKSNRLALACVLIGASALCQAEQPTKQSTAKQSATYKTDQKNSSKSAAKKSSSPTGPLGIGNIKVGMSKAEVEAIPAEDLVALTAPMTPAKLKKEAQPGEETFESKIKMPGADSSLSTMLTFNAGKLVSIQVNTDQSSDAFLEGLEKQVSDKYGSPTVKDSRTEENCIYRNGSNFKISKGEITKRWTTSLEGMGVIETSLWHLKIANCPESLTHGMSTLNIRRFRVGIQVPEAPSKPNIF